MNAKLRNKKKAFRKLANNRAFRHWLNLKAQDIETRVKEAMSPENLKVEVYDSKAKKWKLKT